MKIYNKHFEYYLNNPEELLVLIYEIPIVSNFINWKEISKFKFLNEKFIRLFKDNLYWKYICKYQILNKKFIKEFKNKIFWKNITKYQKLDIDFIKEFVDYLDWNNISERLSRNKLNENIIIKILI